MKARDNNKRKQKQATPIVDGDARPDININPTAEKDHPISTPRDRDKGVTTKNRNDKNSLEDFRDAKQE
jgi:hypothetical protein